MPALADRTAETLVMTRLEGLPGDPKLPAAYRRLQHIVIDLAVSVDHARAALEFFDQKFPSPHELKDSLFNLREQFEPPLTLAEQKKQWEAEGATYDPNWSQQLLGKLKPGSKEELDAIRLQSMQDCLWYTTHPQGQAAWRAHLQQIRDPKERQREKPFWDLAKQHHEREHTEEFAQLRKQMSETGAWDEYLAGCGV